MDQPLLDELRARFPEAAITEVYALTEQGVCFSVNDGSAGFPVSYLEEATPQGRRLRVNGEGEGELEVFDEESQAWFRTGDLEVERPRFASRKGLRGWRQPSGAQFR